MKNRFTVSRTSETGVLWYRFRDQKGNSGLDVEVCSTSRPLPGSHLRQGVTSSHDQCRMDVDYDIHGLLGVRLIDAAPADVSAIDLQFSAFQRSLISEPDVVVRFVDTISAPGLCYVEPNKTGFADQSFFLLSRKHRELKMEIAFEKVGNQCEIICERGANPLILLTIVLRLIVLTKGYVPLHGSAFVHNGTGVILLGWAGSGKTQALLAFLSKGAEYVGDECTLVDLQGRKMCGLPEMLELRQCHLRYAPHVRRYLSIGEVLLTEASKWLDRLCRISSRNGNRISPKTFDRALRMLARKCTVFVPSEVVFGKKALRTTARPDKIFLLIPRYDGCISIERVCASELASRISALAEHEHADLLSYYQAYRFAFPRRGNYLIENAPKIQAKLIQRSFAGRDTFIVRYPHPMVAPEVCENILGFL